MSAIPQDAALRLYQVSIGLRGGAPRLSFTVMAPDSCTAVAQHLELALPGERMEVKPLREVAHG